MISLRRATEEDLDQLAYFNKQLIEDEGSRNPMTVPQLRERMAEWLTSALWSIDCFVLDERTIGYAVWQLRQDEYQPARSIAHIRQLFIERERRNAGLGSAAIRALVEQRFPPSSEILIEVLASNPKGRRFWAKVGFSEYATTMLR